MRMGPDDTQGTMKCSESLCSCLTFRPGADLRSCDQCGHSWIQHALEKLEARRSSGCGPVEVAVPGLVLDLSSLVLFGAQAVPVRLKILLDRLYSILTPQQVGHILHTLGWSLGDYVRGYKLQDSRGRSLDQWLMATAEEEQLVLKQFLRFGETRPIVEIMTRAFQRSSAKDTVSSLKPTLQKPNGPKMAEKQNVKFLTNPDKPRPPPLRPASDPDHVFMSSPYPSIFSYSSPKLPQNLLPPISSSFFCGPPSLSPVDSPCTSLGARKGRVCCGVCGKSFYDKGTLKIHHNAVHLKIKHRCTVSGCTMVFSSLRSRNRHSANPNPRLHTTSVSNKDDTFHQNIPENSHKTPQNQLQNELKRQQNGLNDDFSLKCDATALSLQNEHISNHSEDFENYNLSEAQIEGLNSQWRWEVMPKKKPRKSSMPVKIEREKDHL